MRRLAYERMDLPLESDGAKVREGQAGSGAILSPEVRARLDELWLEEITAGLGFPDYASLAQVLAQKDPGQPTAG